MIIDTHAHLYYPQIKNNLNEILQRASDSGIEKIIVPAVDLQTSRTIIELCEKNEMIYGALGVHPCDVKKNELKVLDEVEKLLDHEKIVAVGETGLDYYWDKSNIGDQKEFFRRQIDLAFDKKLPVVIHTRNSLEDAIEIVKEKYRSGLKGQFHCFSGSVSQAEEILSLENFHISFCGNVTYPKFDSLDALNLISAERMLSETDSPFLPPVPFRGKKNEPSYIVHTIKFISGKKNIGEDDLKKTLYNNAEKLFFS